MNSKNSSGLGIIPESIPSIVVICAFIGGLISLAGWVFNTPRLTDWWNTGIGIKANTAMFIMAAATALFTIIYDRGALRYISRFLAIFVLLGGGLTLIEHLVGIDLGIDTLLFDEQPGAVATAAPGRMGPPAALSFFSLGIAIFCRTLSADRHTISVWLSILVFSVCSLSMVGYLYGAEVMYTIPRLTGISVQTAIMLTTLALALLATCTRNEPIKTLLENSNIGLIARRMLAVAFVMPIILGWLRIQGFRAGLYDNSFGTALRSIAEIVVLVSMLAWSVRAIRSREIKQHRAEAEKKSSQRRLIVALESMPDGFITIDQSGRFNYVNASAAKMFGHSQRELIGNVWWEIFPAIRETALVRQLERAMQESLSIEVEDADFIAGGKRHFCYRIHADKNYGISVYMQDITERKQAQDALRDADRHKDEFIAILAHELRNPLAPIRASAALLNLGNVSTEILQSSAQVIERQVKHMARLLEDLLDISRISNNRLEIRKELVELNPVIESAIETSLPAIQKAKHELCIELPSERIFVEADAVRLAQVFSNVLNNAAQYTPRQGRIRVFINCDSASVTINIEDNGIGIDEASLPRIFSMFTQITSVSPEVKSGLGIGLALASKIIALHGGSIDVSSQGLKQGSTFSIRLPIAQGPARSEAASLDTPPNSAKRRLLVVDDLKDNADSLAALLKQLGHAVAVAYDGRSALAMAESFKPEILFLDIGMPELDGIEVCEIIRQHDWGVQMYIAALTGWGQSEDLLRTREAGFNAHLVKPVNLSDLIDLLSLSDRASPIHPD